MKHLGDITKISGYDVLPVDCVIGGSPCQDLSIAGKRAGLSGERSGLFMEQIRIVKEMREADKKRGRTGNMVRPRFLVWENVPGAFSSNKGNDFRAVLEETIRIAEPNAPDIPLPEKGKWPLADCWYGDGWSVAYRVLDAQFWGVPQRRRRIALVADFGGHAAPEILFVRESVCWDIAAGGALGEETAAGTGSGAGQTVYCLATQKGGAEIRSDDKAPTLKVVAGMSGNNQPVVYNTDTAINFQERARKPGGGKGILIQKNRTGALSTLNNQYVARWNGDGKTACTLTGDHQSRVTDYTAIVMRQHNFGEYREGIGTLTAGTGTRHTVENLVITGVDCRNGTESPDVVGTLQAHNNGGFSLNCTHPVRICGQLRRLTPLECERLQGYPDGWTDIGPWTDSKGKLYKESSDSARYKALGNSIALPPWKWVLKRLCAQYERDATMASLFDGIGGFPLIWERLNGPGSCLWASEIEEFPIAVTKVRFGGENENRPD